jgi:hypothetical protein
MNQTEAKESKVQAKERTANWLKQRKKLLLNQLQKSEIWPRTKITNILLLMFPVAFSF